VGLQNKKPLVDYDALREVNPCCDSHFFWCDIVDNPNYNIKDE